MIRETTNQITLFSFYRPEFNPDRFLDQIAAFREFATDTVIEKQSFETTDDKTVPLPIFINEFWTAKQRAAHSIHEISYRACFKPQLPRFFISRLTSPGDVVYDPFAGRGTTLIESALMGRQPAGCDINPLSRVLILPRLSPPNMAALKDRLMEINLNDTDEYPEDLLAFYHPQTLREICALKKYFHERNSRSKLDDVDVWIRMVAVNRLTGHSPGFFSVYTLPPNQAVTVERQRKINLKRNQDPPRRDVVQIILKKSRSLLTDCTVPYLENLQTAHETVRFIVGDSSNTPEIPSDSIHLVVTSPPFLDVVNYAYDNWLRCWFIGVDSATVPISIHRKVEDWSMKMGSVFRELHRVLVPGRWIAFEVGDVRGDDSILVRSVISAGVGAGLEPVCVLINTQSFTKTANCWGISNNSRGTNSNRIVCFRKGI